MAASCSSTDDSDRPPLGKVAGDPPVEANLLRASAEDSEVEQVANTLGGEEQDALHDHHIGGLDYRQLVGAAVAGEVVYRYFHRLARPEPAEVLDQQLVVERVGVVVVDRRPLLDREVGAVVVVGVEAQHARAVRPPVPADATSDPVGEGRLAGTAAATDTDEDTHRRVNLVAAPTAQPFAYLASSTMGTLDEGVA